MSGGVCTACPAGQFNAYTGRYYCSLCRAGTRCPSEGMVAEERCPKGTYSQPSGQVECRKCQPGKYQPYEWGYGWCYGCSGGYTCPEEGMSSMVPCEAGKYSTYGSLTCKQCPKGKYQRSAGRSYCNKCPKGYMCPAEGMSSVSGRACPPGHWCPEESSSSSGAGATTALPCIAGTHNSETEQTSESACVPWSKGDDRVRLGFVSA